MCKAYVEFRSSDDFEFDLYHIHGHENKTQALAYEFMVLAGAPDEIVDEYWEGSIRSRMHVKLDRYLRDVMAPPDGGWRTLAAGLGVGYRKEDDEAQI
ncbi:hypothetical protein TrRE_jg1423, partial [Triparma retinervis]